VEGAPSRSKAVRFAIVVEAMPAVPSSVKKPGCAVMSTFGKVRRRAKVSSWMIDWLRSWKKTEGIFLLAGGVLAGYERAEHRVIRRKQQPGRSERVAPA